MSEIRPFTVNISDDVLARIMSRVEAFRWFPAPEAGDEWAVGMSTPFLKDIQAYWLKTYDWRAAEKTLNAWPQYKTQIDGLDIHFLHVVGEAGGKRPLLLTHGRHGKVNQSGKPFSTLLNLLLVSAPTALIPATSSTAMKPSNIAYSTALAPRWSSASRAGKFLAMPTSQYRRASSSKRGISAGGAS